MVSSFAWLQHEYQQQDTQYPSSWLSALQRKKKTLRRLESWTENVALALIKSGDFY